MPHCTRHLGWYVGKFLVGLTGMLFLYLNYLREKELECICPIRDRELERQKGKIASCPASDKTAATARKGCARTRGTDATVSGKRHKMKTKQAKRATTAAQASVAAQDAGQLTSQWHDVIKRKLCRIVDRIERAIKKQIEPKHLPPIPESRQAQSTCRRCDHRKLCRWRTRRLRSHRRRFRRRCGTTSTTTDTIQVNDEEDTSTSSIIGCSNNIGDLTSSSSVERAETIQDMEREFHKTLLELERLDQTFAIPESSAAVDTSSWKSSTMESLLDRPDVFSSTRLPGGAIKHLVSRDLVISKNSCRKQTRLDPNLGGEGIYGKPSTRDSLRDKVRTT